MPFVVALFIVSWISYGYGQSCYACNSYENTSWLYDPTCSMDEYSDNWGTVSTFYNTCRISLRYDIETGLPDGRVIRYMHNADEDVTTCRDRGPSFLDCFCKGDVCNLGLCEHCFTWPTTDSTDSTYLSTTGNTILSTTPESTHLSTEGTDNTILSTTPEPTHLSTEGTDNTILSTTPEPTHLSTKGTDNTILSTTPEPTQLSTEGTDNTIPSTTPEPTHLSTESTDNTILSTTPEPTQLSTEGTDYTVLSTTPESTVLTTKEPVHTTDLGNLDCYSCIDCSTITEDTRVVSSPDYLSCFTAIELGTNHFVVRGSSNDNYTDGDCHHEDGAIFCYCSSSLCNGQDAWL